MKQGFDKISFHLGKRKDPIISDISGFISKIDRILIDPICKRPYFNSYDEMAERFISSAHVIFSVAGDTKAIVGLSVLYADSARFDYAHEAFIGVLEGYQGLGIAKELMKREIDLAVTVGMKGMITICHQKNNKKARLNLAMGFQEIADSKRISFFESMNPKWTGKRFFLLEF